jgi:CRP-like cAMP-binding protein
VHLLLPGDLVGLETCMLGVADFGVEAVTDVTFCSFDSDRFPEVAATPGISRRIMMLQAHESSMIAERLTAVGACDARRNLAHLIASLHLRLLKLGLAQERGFRLPLSIQQIADCCGLTPVHVHRVLRALREENVVSLDCRKIEILDPDALRHIARVASIELPQDAIL